MHRLVGLFLLLAATGAPDAKTATDVFVVNTNTDPVPVTITRDPANGRFQADLTVDLFPGVTGNTSGFFVVPTGKVMVIEHVSVHGYVPNGQKMLFDLQTFSTGVSEHHWLESVDEGGDFPEILYDGTPVVAEVFRVSEALRLYGDSDSNLFFTAQRNSAVGQGRASITISGYFADAVP